MSVRYSAYSAGAELKDNTSEPDTVQGGLVNDPLSDDEQQRIRAGEPAARL